MNARRRATPSPVPVRTDGPDAHRAHDLYHWRAASYDLQLLPYEPLRHLAAARLNLRPGQVVLDVGAGTGLSLPLLCQAVGEGGRVLAIEPSEDMLAVAQRWVRNSGWRQVELQASTVEAARLPEGADAALLHFTHDVLQSPAALDHVLAHLRPGARLVCTGLKYAAPWCMPLNTLVAYHAAQSVTTTRDLDCPWRPLQERGLRLTVEPFMMDTVFIASATLD